MYRSYVLLLLFFFCLLSLPFTASERLRSFAVGSLSWGWRALYSHPDLEKLTQENHLLRSQIEEVRQWLLSERRLQEEMQRYHNLLPLAKENDFFKRRAQELCRALDLQLTSLPARVVFRGGASWNSTLWINVGERDNRQLKLPVVCKHSPVVLGTSIVGVVEYVGEWQSRVRLITDASLVISVRAVRGELQNQLLLKHLNEVLLAVHARADLLNAEALSSLNQLKQSLQTTSNDLYLAKGELKGGGEPLWRSRGATLKGMGFNYDFADSEGPARDLLSDTAPLLRTGDVLVTTGLDGIFPAAFKVATVSLLKPLKEGATSYEIEALPTALDLETLSHVTVLPPLKH